MDHRHRRAASEDILRTGDLEKLFKLESWIKNAGHTVPIVVASHDRDFLDACTTKTLFLRPEESVSFAHPYRRARVLLDAHDTAAQTQREKTLRAPKTSL